MANWFAGMFKGRTAARPAAPETPMTVAAKRDADRIAREAALKAEAEAWEEHQRREHLEWIARGVAETERQRRLAEVNRAWFPEDEGRGGLAEITLRDNEWINLDTRRRGRLS